MKILVTGAKGFIGSTLVKSLREKRHSVVECDLPSCDITKNLPEESFDVIYHLAVVPRPESHNNPQKAIDVNVKGTVNVLELAKKRAAKIIFSSASSVYGIPVWVPVKETDRPDPVSIYGTTKYAGELLIQTYYKLYGIDYLIFRFTNVYGKTTKNAREVIPSFLNALKHDEPIIINGSGNQTRDFIYIDDVIHFLIRALEPDKKNMILNLGSGKETSINELVKIIEKVSGKKAKIISRPVEHEERWRFCSDISHLIKVFGEAPRVSLEQGIKKMWEVM